MSTPKSPQIKQRQKKSGRTQLNVYLLPDEVTELDEKAEKTGISRSAIIAQRYLLGKQTELSK